MLRRPDLMIILLAMTLGACDGPTAQTGEPVPVAAGSGTAAHEMATLPPEHRVAFMAGHVVAGLALYRAGAADEAAPHLLHPVSETHAAERAGIEALGFDATPFEAVSAALEQGRDAAGIEPMLAAAEANIALVRQNAGGDPAGIIDYLMDTTEQEYAIGVRDGRIADAGEYQDAYGFSVVALQIAPRLAEPARSDAMREIEALVGLWPEGGPLARSEPTPVDVVSAQIARVRRAVTPGR